MIKLYNKKRITEELTDILIRIAKEINFCEIDVYLHIEDESLYMFSEPQYIHLDDDYLRIYRYSGNSEFFTFYDDIYKFADFLGFERNEFMQMISEYCSINLEDIEYSDAWEFIRNNKNYYKALKSAYDKYVDDHRQDYKQKAEEIIDKFEDGI